MASQYKNLDEFLSKHKFVSDSSSSPTHTRIGNKTLKINGGSYTILEEEKTVFYELYHKKVFIDKKNEYLTEKQIGDGPILIDFDFKFSVDIDKRLYTKDHVETILGLYLDTLKTMIEFTDEPFPIFIMEKKDVNRCVEKELTKEFNFRNTGIQKKKNVKCNFIFLGYFSIKDSDNNEKENKLNYKKIDNITLGLHAYIINRKGAEKLLNNAFPIVDQLDSYISFMAINRNVNCYKPKNISFFYQNNDQNTTIQTDFALKPYITQYDDSVILSIMMFILLLIILLIILHI